MVIIPSYILQRDLCWSFSWKKGMVLAVLTLMKVKKIVLCIGNTPTFDIAFGDNKVLPIHERLRYFLQESAWRNSFRLVYLCRLMRGETGRYRWSCCEGFLCEESERTGCFLKNSKTRSSSKHHKHCLVSWTQIWQETLRWGLALFKFIFLFLPFPSQKMREQLLKWIFWSC